MPYKSEAQRKFFNANKDKINEYQRNYRAKNKVNIIRIFITFYYQDNKIFVHFIIIFVSLHKKSSFSL